MTPSPPSPRTTAPDDHPVVLFDGVCNLCNGWVDFLIARDARGLLRFASLQSAAAQERLASTGCPPEAIASDGGTPSTLVLLEGGHAYVRSTAALRTLRHLGTPWSWLWALRWVPSPVRDAVYMWVAAHRYAWFGKSETCRVATPSERARFLEP
jgi:predicted DCC family thiol-disulfide oxidoreductase YuxK